MATDRPNKPLELSIDDAVARIRQRIESQQSARTRATSLFKVSTDERGRITAVKFIPPEVRIA